MSKYGLALREDGLHYIDTSPQALGAAGRSARHLIDSLADSILKLMDRIGRL